MQEICFTKKALNFRELYSSDMFVRAFLVRSIDRTFSSSCWSCSKVSLSRNKTRFTATSHCRHQTSSPSNRVISLIFSMQSKNKFRQKYSKRLNKLSIVSSLLWLRSNNWIIFNYLLGNRTNRKKLFVDYPPASKVITKIDSGCSEIYKVQGEGKCYQIPFMAST